MSKTRGLLMKLIWVRRKTHRWHWYDWDTSFPTCTDRTETPKKICSCLLILHTLDCVRIKNNNESFFGRLSHMCASSGRSVSVISVSTVSFASHSYRSKFWFKRLTHISFSSNHRVSLISVSFGSFCRSPIRHPPKVLTKIREWQVILRHKLSWCPRFFILL